MKLWKRYHNLNQRSKKYIAVGLCAGIALFGVTIPLPDMRGDGVNAEASARKQPSSESSVTLDLKSSMAVRETAELEDAGHKSGNSVEERGIIDRFVAGEETGVGNVANLQVEKKLDQISEKPSSLEQNLSGITDYGKEEEASNLELYTYSDEDHGTSPETAVRGKGYQYPIELGYAVDLNYDGKQIEPLPDLMKLKLDDWEEETEESSETKQNISKETDESAEAEQNTSGKAAESAEAEQNTSGKAAESAEAEQNTSGKTAESVETKQNTSEETAESAEAGQNISEETAESSDEKTGSMKQTDSAKGSGTEEPLADEVGNAEEQNTEVSGQDADGETAKALDREEKIRLRTFLKNIYHQILSVEPVMTEEYLDAGRIVADPAMEIAVESDTDSELASDEEENQNTDSDSDTASDSDTKQNTDIEDSSETDRTAEDVSETNDISEGASEANDGSESPSDANAASENATETEDGAQDQTEAQASSEDSSQVDDRKEEASAEKETSDDAKAVDEHQAGNAVSDAGRFLVKGLRREGSDVYTGDIQIIPSGENGFNKVRVGAEGEFSDSVTLRKDTASKEIELYFSNGDEVACTTFSYAKDTENPSIEPDDKAYKILTTSNGSIYCLNSSQIGFRIEDGEQSAGIQKAILVYGDRFGFVLDEFDTPCYTLPENYYGLVYYSCFDRAGNASEAASQYYLIEKNAPTIRVVESEHYTAPYTMGISVEDTGSIISGIDQIECTVNGETYEPNNITQTEYVRLADDLEVPSKEAFSIDFPETGHYDISIRVSDNCGNAVVFHKAIDVTEAELVSVYLAKEFKLYVDPDCIFGKEQVFSDGLALKNVSDVDTKITIKEINVNVNSETLDDGTVKDCTLYMIAPDTGERIPLKHGVNTDVYSYRIPVDAAEELSELNFVGELSEGSEAFWNQGDVSLNIKFSFEKWEE